MTQTDPFLTALHGWIEIFMRRSTRNLIRYTRESGLSMSQVGALLHIHREGSSAVSHLGDGLGVTNAAASQMLDRLVGQDLITRSEDPHDRRVKQIVLTDKGRQLLTVGMRARLGWLDDLAEKLTEDEKRQVTAALEILIDKAHQFEN